MSRKCLLDCSANGAKWADDVQLPLQQFSQRVKLNPDQPCEALVGKMVS